MTVALDQLLRHPDLWRAGDDRVGRAATRSVPSGDASLDGWLPGGGWPAAALTELLCEHHGIGEFSLLLPLLARSTAESERVALVAPPLLPYAPALAAGGVDLEHLLLIRPRVAAEGFWAAEQLLRSRVFAVVITWVHGEPNPRALRRLQLAAEQGDACMFVFRDLGKPHDAYADDDATAPAGSRRETGRSPEASPATLRVSVTPCGSRVRAAARGERMPRLLLSTLKCRGRAPARPLVL